MTRQIFFLFFKTFLSDQNISYNYQSGFRANHLTNLCLSFLTENFFKKVWQRFVNCNDFNLQKAFDTIDHEMLLQKLNPNLKKI